MLTRNWNGNGIVGSKITVSLSKLFFAWGGGLGREWRSSKNKETAYGHATHGYVKYYIIVATITATDMAWKWQRYNISLDILFQTLNSYKLGPGLFWWTFVDIPGTEFRKKAHAPRTRHHFRPHTPCRWTRSPEYLQWPLDISDPDKEKDKRLHIVHEEHMAQKAAQVINNEQRTWSHTLSLSTLNQQTRHERVL